jgi:hypothetical protein
MKGLPCAIALKSDNGRQKHHTQAGLHVLLRAGTEKSAGMRITYGGGAGNPRGKTARAKK